MGVLVLGHLGQRVVRLQDGERLAEEVQRLVLDELEGVGHPQHVLADGVDGEVSLVEVPAEVVQGLLLGGPEAGALQPRARHLGLQVRRLPNTRRDTIRTDTLDTLDLEPYNGNMEITCNET